MYIHLKLWVARHNVKWVNIFFQADFHRVDWFIFEYLKLWIASEMNKSKWAANSKDRSDVQSQMQ